MSESKRLKVNYLIIDNKIDNRFPLFEDIFENYVDLEPIFEQKYSRALTECPRLFMRLFVETTSI